MIMDNYLGVPITETKIQFSPDSDKFICEQHNVANVYAYYYINESVGEVTTKTNCVAVWRFNWKN
jgi:hypothetical protein